MTDRLRWATAVSVSLLVLIGVAYSQDEDLFAFIPDGGRTLLGELIAGGELAGLRWGVLANGRLW